MARAPANTAFVITSVVTLGLAIGAVAGMFSVVNTVILKSLPFPDSARLVAVEGTAAGSDLPERFAVGPEFYLHYKGRSKLLDGIFVVTSDASTFRTPNRVERVPYASPTNDMYATVGVRPQLGRLPVPEDGDDVVLISDQLWSSWFGRDPSVIGKSYFAWRSGKQVIGVMPPGFRFPSDETMFWIPSQIRPENVRAGQGGIQMVARIKQGVTRDQVASELTRLSKELPARFGGSPTFARMIDQHRAVVAPLLERIESVTPNNSVIISRSTAEKLWPGQNPLGRTLRPRLDDQDTLALTVVGVVADVKQDDWRQPGEAIVYFPLTGPAPTGWGPESPAHVVKSSRADRLQPEVRELVRQFAPEAPVYREYTMAFLARRSMLQLTFTMLTLGLVAGLALLLGVIGLYGVLSYVVVVGLGLGVAVAFAATRLLGTLLYGVKPVDPIVFTAMSVMMIVIGALASYMPARRASSVNPIESLRTD